MKQQFQTILCDFDGTISSDDVTDTLLTSLTDDKWITYGEMYVKGKISHAQMNKHFASLLKASPIKVNCVLDTIKLRNGLTKLIKDCKEKNVRFIIISSGWDYYIKYLFHYPIFQIDDIELVDSIPDGVIPLISNKVKYDSKKKKWTLTLPWENLSCSLSSPCKGQLLDLIRNKLGGKIMVIGNSESDLCMAEKGDMVYSVGALKQLCDKKGLQSNLITSFSEIRL